MDLGGTMAQLKCPGDPLMTLDKLINAYCVIKYFVLTKNSRL